MKLSCSTLPFKDWSFPATVEFCKSHGISGLELRIALNDWSTLDLSDESIAEMRKILADNDMVITNLGSSICLRGYSDEQFNEFIKCAELAQKLDAPAIRFFLGNFIVNWDDEVASIDEAGIIEFLQKACDYGAERNVAIWIETHNEYSEGSTLRELLDKIDRPNCAIIWDIIHPLELGESIADTIQYIGGDIAHIHVKDGVPFDDTNKANYKYTKLGDGVVPIHEIVKLLNETGFDGFYSLEWENTWRAEIAHIQAEEIIPEFAEYMKTAD